jgi:hypothetical protein
MHHLSKKLAGPFSHRSSSRVGLTPEQQLEAADPHDPDQLLSLVSKEPAEHWPRLIRHLNRIAPLHAGQRNALLWLSNNHHADLIGKLSGALASARFHERDGAADLSACADLLDHPAILAAAQACAESPLGLTKLMCGVMQRESGEPLRCAFLLWVLKAAADRQGPAFDLKALLQAFFEAQLPIESLEPLGMALYASGPGLGWDRAIACLARSGHDREWNLRVLSLQLAVEKAAERALRQKAPDTRWTASRPIHPAQASPDRPFDRAARHALSRLPFVRAPGEQSRWLVATWMPEVQNVTLASPAFLELCEPLHEHVSPATPAHELVSALVSAGRDPRDQALLFRSLVRAALQRTPEGHREVAWRGFAHGLTQACAPDAFVQAFALEWLRATPMRRVPELIDGLVAMKAADDAQAHALHVLRLEVWIGICEGERRGALPPDQASRLSVSLRAGDAPGPRSFGSPQAATIHGLKALIDSGGPSVAPVLLETCPPFARQTVLQHLETRIAQGDSLLALDLSRLKRAWSPAL